MEFILVRAGGCRCATDRQCKESDGKDNQR